MISLNWIKDYIVDQAEPEWKLTSSKAKKILDGMLKITNIFDVYTTFLKESYGITFKKSKKINFEDAVALLYIKQYLFGVNKYNKINNCIMASTPSALLIV